MTDLREYKDCFFDPKTLTTIDVIDPETGLGAFGKRDLASAIADYGDQVVIADFDRCHELCEDGCRSEPEEITEEKFLYGLGVLPPVSWVRNHDTETFKISERIYGSITAIYCRLGSRYFTFNDDGRMKHSEIVAKCDPLVRGVSDDNLDK